MRRRSTDGSTFVEVMATRRDLAGAASWRAVAACLCTTILGLGLARFAYTPLIPALIGAHWFSPGQAVYLGAANIGGYLVGAVLARVAARMLGVRASLRTFMCLATLSLLACALRWGFPWFLAWRLLSGINGAGLTVLAAPSVLPLLPERHRGLAGGLIFLGIGLGIVASGTVLPLLLRGGVVAAWLGLAAAGVVLTALAWAFLPQDPPATGRAAHGAGSSSAALRALFAAYAGNAIGQVPAILFLADFVARSLGLGVGAGAWIWAVFGMGALAGPVTAGLLADRIGYLWALRTLWVSQVAAFLALVAWPSLVSVVPASLVLGAGVPAAVVLVLGRSQMLARPDAEARRRAWSMATICFALGQAVGGYALSYLFTATGRYDLLFCAGAAFEACGFVATEVSDRLARSPQR
jgi:predicted MFS family arabinose efflux permease